MESRYVLVRMAWGRLYPQRLHFGAHEDGAPGTGTTACYAGRVLRKSLEDLQNAPRGDRPGLGHGCHGVDVVLRDCLESAAKPRKSRAGQRIGIHVGRN